MKIRLAARLLIIAIIISLITSASGFFRVYAAPEDAWWDPAWPYRIPLTMSASGAVAVTPDFTALFAKLGLPGALLDLQSVRIVPYTNGLPGEPVPYEETLSTRIMDEEPLILGGDTFSQSATISEPCWVWWDQSSLSLDTSKWTQGSSSLKATMIRRSDLSLEPAFTYYFNDSPFADWSGYEVLTYDAWPEVNASAIDQTPDVFRVEFLGLESCFLDKVNGPALAMDQWNNTSTSLLPLGNCTTPDYSQMEGLRFFLATDLPGAFQDGDALTLWLDNLRLVDQDGAGEIRWMAEETVERYYLYFDTLNHASHVQPELTTLDGDPFTAATTGAAEAGGYFHQISGVSTTELTLWSAPNVEKVFKDQTAPLTEKPLLIQAARGEFEAFQVVIQSPTDRDLAVTISDLVNEKAVIPASQVQLFRVDYVPLTQLSDFYGRTVDWPDPLFPLSPGDRVHLRAGENQPLWVRIEVPTGVPAGTYAGIIALGQTVVPYALEVWDFSLPANAFLEVSVGFDWEAVLAAYGGTNPDVSTACLAELRTSILDTLADFHLTPNPALDSIQLYSLTEYEVQTAQAYQAQTGNPVWWTFTGRDHPPLPNPAVLDRTGLDARVLPTLAWLERVDGLYYAQAVDWDADPWAVPFSNDLSNGDGVLFYPPNDNTLGDDPCDPESNRLIPSIRLELLREGLEDYAYLWLLNARAPEIGLENESDVQLQTIIASRTAFTRSPVAALEIRATLADLLQGKHNAYYLPLVFK